MELKGESKVDRVNERNPKRKREKESDREKVYK